MKNRDPHSKIETSFRKLIHKDKKIQNAYLLVQSEKLGIDLNIAAGKTGSLEANIHQPNHLASVGKLFTATLIGLLYEKKLLDFNDPIARHLDGHTMSHLHVFKGKDYSDQIMIRHLLMQTSGLNDVFYQLFEKIQSNPSFKTTPKKAINWGKANLKPVAIPGKKHIYTDTNYYLLGLIIENITQKSFHEVMHELIFDPLGMENAFVYGFSKPKKDSSYPIANAFIEGKNLLLVDGIHQIDWAGGSIVAPLAEFLIFIKSLVQGKLIREQTLTRMIKDDIWMGFPTVGFRYGYSIWKPVKIPLILPSKYYCWGCVGATGAFMFYHPLTKSYLIGSFNDFSYRGKALEFMLKNVVKVLLKHHNENL